MTKEISISIDLAVKTCKNCGGTFAIADEYVNECRRLGNFRQMWACPYCKKTWGFGESEADRLRKQLKEKEDARAREEAARKYAETEASYFRKDRDATAAALKRHKKRVS